MQLSQRLAQTLVLSPQLQQSLALLQAPALELKALVEQELQQNPVLEEVPEAEVSERDREAGDAETPDTPDTPDPAEPPDDVKFDADGEKDSDTPEPVDDFQAEFEKLVQADQDWRDHFSQANQASHSSAEDEERRQFMIESITTGTSLAEHLLDQLRDTEATPAQREIATLIIGNMDDHGYLGATVEEMAAVCRGRACLRERWNFLRGAPPAATTLPLDQVLAALKLVQSFDPAGIAARDLRECLLLQLERDDRADSLEYRMVRDHMEALGRRRIPEIARGTGQPVEEVQAALLRVGRLDPHPGHSFLPEPEQYVAPEVFVQRSGDGFTVTTNEEQVPHLRISNVYKDLMAQGGNSAEVKSYIREKIRAGKYLIKSLHLRQQTILNIAREIVKRQHEFMEHGVAHLRPMTMVQVASEVGVHETTVSRAVSGKYMETPHGVFEMKFFFTGGLATASGAEVSNTSVKDMIAEIFRGENPAHPMSDQEVLKILQAKGITIARRTIAKYRDELGILPSSQRRVY